MEVVDPVALTLARVQFTFTVSFHIIFPGISIGLASYLAVLEGLHIWTGRPVFLRAFRFWIKPFALVFGMGVVSGIVMSYQFGTNWSVFSDKVGPVLGPLLGYEVLSAFFLEAGFLGIMLFGTDRVSRGLHFFATCMVAFGTLLSAFWILSANSWMHTPAGHAIDARTGQFVVESWWAVVFNPSFPYRFAHMVLAAYLSTAMIVGATAAFALRRGEDTELARTHLTMAMAMALFVAPLQLMVGDLHGLNTLEHQPAKVAAMEGHYTSHEGGAPFILFGIPNDAEARMDWALSIPHLGSLILVHDWSGAVKGLDAFPPDERPSPVIVFWTFRIMVALGLLMIAMGIVAAVLYRANRLWTTRWFLAWALAMGPSGLVAVLAGWFTTEIGRQPWTVYGLLRTADSLSPVAAPAVATSLAAFVIVYLAVFGAGTVYLVRLLARPQPDSDEGGTEPTSPDRASGTTPAPAPLIALVGRPAAPAAE